MRLAASIVLVACLVFAGCGGDGDDAADGASGSNNGGGGEEGSTVSLPDNFPADVPLYPDARIEMAHSEGSSLNLIHKTSDSVDDVSQFFKTKLAEAGWADSETMDTPRGAVISVSQGNRRVTITIVGEDDKTMISTLVVTEM